MSAPTGVVADSRDDLTNYIRTKQFNDTTMLALRQHINDVGNQVAGFSTIPPRSRGCDRMANLRNRKCI